jgi:SAM-dependent methyltransferase
MSSIQPHNEKPAGVWNSGGGRYDEISRGIADSIEHCVLRLDPKPGEKILDLATGTGWTSRLVAKRGAQVIGADISADLIAFATQRATEEGLSITYQTGDAEKLPFADGEFDAVISTCGVMFASRPEAAAAELARVCRKGGRIALTTWLSDSNLFKMFMVMKPYMSPPPTPAPPSPFEWGRTERIEKLLGRDFDLAFEKGVSFYRERRGRRSPTATARPRPSPSAWTRVAARNCAEISSPSMRGSQLRLEFACPVNIGSRAASGAKENQVP